VARSSGENVAYSITVESLDPSSNVLNPDTLNDSCLDPGEAASMLLVANETGSMHLGSVGLEASGSDEKIRLAKCT
jgi:hypothetical protein